jgi:hypothetical protein
MITPETHDEPFTSPETAEVTRLLDDLKASDPPAPGLVKDVMAHLQSIQAGGSRPRHESTRMAKKVMFGLAAAAALLIGVFVATGWPPAGLGTEGTVGAAKRYQAQKMSADDVKLGDTAAQQFLQSDLGDRLMKDPQARTMLADAGLQAALKNKIKQILDLLLSKFSLHKKF